MLALAAAVGWNIFQDELMRAAFVPPARFTEPSAAGAPDYLNKADSWLSAPGLMNDPARWVPEGFSAATKPEVAVFYVAPTAYLRRDRWNAPLRDREADQRLRLFVSTQASAFNGVGAVWAPRYRQAAIGAFLTTVPDAERAIDFAYGDVARAFDAFLAAIPADQPIILAGHSQGSLHLMRLLKDRVAGQPLARRIVAAYLAGWPVSVEADLPELGLEACTGPGQSNCILSWQSFAEPAEPRLIRDIYDRTAGLTGKPRKGTGILCINPLTGAPGTAALAAANSGSLIANNVLSEALLEPGRIPARCDDASGLLLIGAPPQGYGAFVLPGNNYHVFDYALFWANIRADVEARTRNFLNRSPEPAQQ